MADPSTAQPQPAALVGQRLIPPYSWFFTRSRWAFLFAVGVPLMGWLALVLLRRFWWTGCPIFWNEEIPVAFAFAYAGGLSLLLSHLFHRLMTDLGGIHQEVDRLLAEQHESFHRPGLLVGMPLIVAAFAISARFYSLESLNPFVELRFDLLFCGWLYLGFLQLLQAIALCGRYSEIVRRLGEAAVRGYLRRKQLHSISAFYLKVALLASLDFAFGALMVSSLNIIYGYNGANVPAAFFWQLVQGGPLLVRTFSRSLGAIIGDPILIEVFMTLSLYAAASMGAVVYFLVPQWGVHKLLQQRKQAAADRIETMLEESEAALIAQPGEVSLERFTRYSLVQEAVDRMPEWPFRARGVLGTLLLFGIPSILVLLKEFFLQAIVNLLTQ